eukprot:g5243.t1
MVQTKKCSSAVVKSSSKRPSKTLSKKLSAMKFMRRKEERRAKAANDELRRLEAKNSKWVINSSTSSSTEKEIKFVCIADNTVGNENNFDLHVRLTGGRKSYNNFNANLDPNKLRADSFDKTNSSDDEDDHIDDKEMASRFEGLRGKNVSPSSRKRSHNKNKRKWDGRGKKDRKMKGEKGHSVYTGLRPNRGPF